MQPADIEAHIAFYIAYDEKDANNEGNNPIIRQADKARIAIFKIAPRDLPRLKMEIAKKTKAFHDCNILLQREILRAEIDGLERLRGFVSHN